jgi:hypothetical protein
VANSLELRRAGRTNRRAVDAFYVVILTNYLVMDFQFHRLTDTLPVLPGRVTTCGTKAARTG